MSVDHLIGIDPIFAECLRVGGPDVADFSRPAGFPGLVRIIMEQQLSTRVALTLWEKLLSRLDPVTPDGFLALDDDTLRACGFSAQKIGYARGIARTVASGGLDMAAIQAMDDEPAIAALTALKGIGRWSAEIYLMSALDRPDVWPVDDLAIALGVQRLKGWAERPDRAALVAVAEPWRPHRSLAARLVWHHYVALQNRRAAAGTVRRR
ncbi:DNA-3-methyladenine glycosylase family protein [Azospirillum halopraeferens]|uniref:DNA-3-methyladenine glycosylase family protein n=1 Tax=Azospirillum halopraeferens TaxID=34010 RepID=UPI0003FCD2A3|nr:DNA-3-methyladenine glycosylase [Azospirillum halopraeferens]